MASTFTLPAPLRVIGIAAAPGEALPAGTEIRRIRRGAVVADLFIPAQDRVVGAYRDEADALGIPVHG